MLVNTLKLSNKAYAYEIDGVLQPPYAMTNIQVDEMDLSQYFGFENTKPWFGRTLFEKQADADLVAFLGNAAPQNQFGSSRFVLFCCHCGCDYCGVISCEIGRTASHIIWRNIAEETDNGVGKDEYEAEPISEFVFDIVQYEQEVRDYAAAISAWQS